MNIFYISKIDNNRMDRISAEGYGIMGSMDLLSPDGTPFPVFYMSLGFIEGVYDLSAQGSYVYATIIKKVYSEEDKWNLLKDTVKKLPESEDHLKKWLTKIPVDRNEDNRYYFYFKNEKILIDTYTSSNFTEQAKDVILDFSPNYERYDWWEPQFDFYFDDIQILEIADTPEELLVIQAAKEGKTMTLEQAKEIAKDWHFGGVR